MRKKIYDLLFYLFITTCLVVILLTRHPLQPTLMWLIAVLLVILVVTVGMLAILKHKSKKSKVIDELLQETIPKAMFRVFSFSGRVDVFVMTYALVMSFPFGGLVVLERMQIMIFNDEMFIYIYLTLVSITTTFLGHRVVVFLNRVIIYNPSEKSIQRTKLYSSENIPKSLLFGFYFIILIISSILKYNHTSIIVFNENSIGPVVQAFTTFIAFDRFVTTYRRAKKIRPALKELQD